MNYKLSAITTQKRERTEEEEDLITLKKWKR
jgi:hypothetical protein